MLWAGPKHSLSLLGGCGPSLRLGEDTVTASECWTQPRTLSVIPENSTAVCRVSCTPSSIGLTFQNESSISSVCSCTDASTTKLIGIWPTTAHQFRTLFSASACIQPAAIKSPFHATGSARTASSGFFCCWSDSLELIAWRHAGSGMFCGQLQTVTEDIFIFAVLVCSAH